MTQKLKIIAVTFMMAGLYTGMASAQGTLFVEDDKVGVGIAIPQHLLHVQASDGTAKVFVQDTSGTTQLRELFKLVNNGGPFFVFADSSIAQSYAMAMFGSDYIIDHQQSSGIELRVKPSGNLEIEGILVEGSSREIKHRIEPVDGRTILEQLVTLPVATWTYRQSETGAVHMGPMAEDFHGTFGLGENERKISSLDVSGVTLAAVQGLYEVVEEQKAEIERLRARLEELEGAER